MTQSLATRPRLRGRIPIVLACAASAAADALSPDVKLPPEMGARDRSGGR